MRELAAMEEALGLRENEKLRAQLAESEQRVKFVESVNAKQEQFVCNTLGKALGFPTDPEGEGICCGDEVLESLCEMGAKRISNLEQRVKALEEALLLVQVLLIHIAAKGHKSGYDWNSDPEYLTLTEGEIHERINKALEATCTNTPKG